MVTLRLRMAVVLLLGLAPMPGRAADLVILTDPTLDYNDAKCVNGGPVVDLHFVYVPAPGDPPIQGIRFSAPDPTGCATFVGRADVWVLPTLGESRTEVLVDLGGCVSTTTHVLTVRLFSLTVLQNCCSWSAQNVVAVDCNGNDVFLSTLPTWFATEPCGFVAPHSPVPADGAEIVASSVALEWQSAGGPACDLGDVLIHNLYFGTDPGSLAGFFDTGTGHTVDGLVPGLTYYWRAEATTYNGAGPYSGPLWSFTVTAPVSASQSTWGRVKALYR